MSEARFKASVVVPCGRSERARDTIEALTRQTLDRRLYEVIVVTHQPEASTPLESLGARVVATNSLLPPGAMRNRGVAASQADTILFIDDDCAPPPEWIERMLARLDSEPTVAAVGSRIIGRDAGFWSRCADFALFSDCQFVNCARRDLAAGALAVRRRALRDVGGFSDDLMASEDWDFSLRLKQAGWACFYDGSVAVIHDHRRTSFSAILKSAYLSGFRSGLRIQRQHRDRMSFPARLAVRLGNPWLYPLLIVPYSTLVTLSYLAAYVGIRGPALLYLPFTWLAKAAYQVGVWVNLLRESDRRCP